MLCSHQSGCAIQENHWDQDLFSITLEQSASGAFNTEYSFLTFPKVESFYSTWVCQPWPHTMIFVPPHSWHSPVEVSVASLISSSHPGLCEWKGCCLTRVRHQSVSFLCAPHDFRLKFIDPIHYVSLISSLTSMFISAVNLVLHELQVNSVLLDIAVWPMDRDKLWMA